MNGGLRALSRYECLSLLGAVTGGRLAVLAGDVPAMRPAEHLTNLGDLVVRLDRLDAAAFRSRPARVLYAAGDQACAKPWAVMVTGHATLIDDPQESELFGALLSPVGTAAPLIRVRPAHIRGVRVVPPRHRSTRPPGRTSGSPLPDAATGRG
ncbi:MAG: hypothetical protein HOV79_11600 [Hamadaea sp.]|nr:hypothetical protein [Hamadaea sp.]